jgi:hypothetical protein
MTCSIDMPRASSSRCSDSLLATGRMLSAELAERDFRAAFQGGRTFYGFDSCAITRP